MPNLIVGSGWIDVAAPSWIGGVGQRLVIVGCINDKHAIECENSPFGNRKSVARILFKKLGRGWIDNGNLTYDLVSMSHQIPTSFFVLVHHQEEPLSEVGIYVVGQAVDELFEFCLGRVNDIVAGFGRPASHSQLVVLASKVLRGVYSVFPGVVLDRRAKANYNEEILLGLGGKP